MTEKSFLTMAGILEKALPVRDVEVPEWGGWMRLRAITNAELARARRNASNPRTGEVDGAQLNAEVVAAGSVEPEFPPKRGAEALMGKEPGILARLSEIILDLSGATEESAEQGEA